MLKAQISLSVAFTQKCHPEYGIHLPLFYLSPPLPPLRLKATIRSLIDGLSEDERAEALLILMVAEADLEYVKKVHEDIRKVFADHLDSGLLEIISPHPSFYPDFDSIKVSGDTEYLGALKGRL